jgi:5-methylcytosine-specific restriction endonuclease McrA
MGIHQDRGEPWRKWYKTARWQKLRLTILLRDRYTCQMKDCGRLHHDTSLLVCDHIEPHRGSAELFWSQANLQTLCKSCHDGLKQQAEQASIHQRGVWY